MIHDSMTSTERLVAALNGDPVDHVPFSPFLAYVWESFPKDVQAAGHLAFYQSIGADPLWRGAPCPVKTVLPPEIETRKVDTGDTILTTVTTPVGALSSKHVHALVERMREHGVFAVESMSPPPTGNLTVKEARAKLGRDMGIIGGIEPTLFLNLSTEELGPYVESVIEDARGGPFILSNSDSCPPGVTVEKAKLVAEVAARLS